MINPNATAAVATATPAGMEGCSRRASTAASVVREMAVQ
jgi:hypothetical protein